MTKLEARRPIDVMVSELLLFELFLFTFVSSCLCGYFFFPKAVSVSSW
jgi:hypothetical protein